MCANADKRKCVYEVRVINLTTNGGAGCLPDIALATADP